MDKLKIDRSLLNDADDADDAAIAQIIIKLAKQLNLSVIAEGDENVPQLEFRRQNGCAFVQVYHFAPAIDPMAFVDWYVEKNVRRGHSRRLDNGKYLFCLTLGCASYSMYRWSNFTFGGCSEDDTGPVRGKRCATLYP